jgi:DnaK suppressor protein
MVVKEIKLSTQKNKTEQAKPEDRVISEKELFAMSDDDYMNDAQLNFFRHKLIEMKGEILKNAQETTENLQDFLMVPDPVDRATIEEEHALELRTRDRERKLLVKIEESLTRIRQGEYGYCEETGEPIGLRRLLARPTATLSLEAQERREKRQKMFGDS